jgi:pimeloyl-ACP methyl ester carboxylesterase
MVSLSFERNFAPILAAGRDLVLFDQRGVGFSEPALDCREVSDLSIELLDQELDGQRITDAEMEALLDAAFRNCEQQLAEIADLSMYNTLASAADVNDLRLALGYDKVDLWGASYGTRLALEVMRDYPVGVRSALLDAVYPPDVDIYLETPASLERALTLLFDACTAQTACDAAYPDLRNVFFETIANLNQDPVEMTISDPLNHRVHSVLFDGDTLFSLVFMLLYESQAQPFLPWLLDQAWRGEMDTLGQVYGSVLVNISLSSRGMMFSVQCNEELSFSTQEQYDEQLRAYPELAPYLRATILGDTSYNTCAFWDSGRAERQENEAVSSEIPALILQGELDPITPPAWSQHAAETLPNSFYVLFPKAAHGALNSECAWGMAVAFLQDPAQAPDATCIAEMEEVPFYIP